MRLVCREPDGRADRNLGLCVQQSGINNHFVNGDGLVRLISRQQVRRLTGNNTVQFPLRCADRDLCAQQHTRVNTADRLESQKSMVERLGDDKADLVEVRIQQDGLCVRFSRADTTDDVAKAVDLDLVAQRCEQLAHALGLRTLKAADHRNGGQLLDPGAHRCLRHRLFYLVQGKFSFSGKISILIIVVLCLRYN